MIWFLLLLCIVRWFLYVLMKNKRRNLETFNEHMENRKYVCSELLKSRMSSEMT